MVTQKRGKRAGAGAMEPAREDLLTEIEELRAQLADARETIEAIRRGEVDALVVTGDGGEQIFTLEGAEHPYRVLVEQMREGAVTLFSDGATLYCNQGFSQILGVPLEKIIGKNIGHFLAPESRAEFERILHQSASDGNKGEIYFINSENARVPTYVSTSTITTDEPQIFSLVIMDLTEHKRADEALHQAYDELEMRIKERTAELAKANADLQVEIAERRRIEERLKIAMEEYARSNAELEQFAYVASHDLQEPLRNVGSFSQLLSRRYRGKLDADADEFIGYIVDGVTRMHMMINDLLTYSRVGMQGKCFEQTDLNDALSESLANLKLVIEENEAVITHDPLPTVLADPVQMVQLFQNLISNAIKFRGEAPPRVHVSAEEQENEWVIFVQDNGIGISPEYQKKIFIIFQRLHSKTAYPGSGIGLAVCKKIAERHGGRIWVTSTLGQGSRFSFSVPKIPRGNLPLEGRSQTPKSAYESGHPSGLCEVEEALRQERNA